MIDASVLITCKDKERFLDDCISSVLRQTKQPKEIIVVHDQCENPAHHPEVASIMLKNNLGVAKARQEAFRYSVGGFIIFVDGDDVLNPDYLERMRMALGDNNDIAYPDIYFFDKLSPKLSVTPNEFGPDSVREMGKLPIPVTCLMKRSVFEELKGFKEYPVMEDLDFWLRAMCKGYTFIKAQTLLWYRQEGERRNLVNEELRAKTISAIFEQFEIKDNTIKLK